MGSSPTKSATSSPTKKGKMREDEYWVLRSFPSKAKKTKEGLIIEEIASDKVPYKFSSKAPEFALEKSFGDSVVWHGRRINDEVELFKLEDGKETPGLRKALEAKGLTVRSYKPEPESKMKYPRPSYKEVLGEHRILSTPLERCQHVVKETIEQIADEHDTDIDFGVLADSGKRRKVMLVIRMRQKDFQAWYNEDSKPTLSWGDQKLEVIGIIENGEPTFKVAEDDVMAFFTKNFTHFDCVYRDQGPIQEQKEREAAKAERKKAKKHRRRVTSSTVASVSDSLTASLPAESDEAVKARQREKNNEKRKAQKERRRARAAAEEEDEDESSVTPTSTIDGDDDDENLVRLGATSGTHAIYTTKDNHVIIQAMPGHRILNLRSLNKGEVEDDDHSLGHEDSSSPSNESEQGKDDAGVDVVQVTTVEEMDRAVQSAKGPIFTVAPEAAEK